MNLPSRITIREEAPREGFQSEAAVIPLERKIAFIDALAATGVGEVNCVSFVDARRVPQMADAEAVIAGLTKRPGTRYIGTWLNERGLARALATQLDVIGKIGVSASDQFAIHNNGRDRAGVLAEQRRMLDLYKQHGIPIETAYVYVAFGCNYEGDIPPANLVEAIAGIHSACAEVGEKPTVVYLCDTVGFASPLTVKRAVGVVRDRWPDLQVGLHLHDTRGMGLANVLAGLELGVTGIDSSCGGLGGCPFSGSKAAAGNVCTEDVVQMCDEMGIETGVDLEAMIECARMAEDIVGHPIPGKVMHAGSVRSLRARALA